MNDLDAFNAAILAHPDEDAPRLICADWLDELGDHDRAEFIRVQCRLAILSADEEPEYSRLREREHELLQLHQTEWRCDLPFLPGVTWGSFERGFVSMATFIEETEGFGFMSVADDIFSAAPIQELRFQRVDAEAMERISSNSWLHRLTILDLECGNRIGATGALALALSPSLVGIRSLNLRSNHIGERGVTALTDSGFFANLRQLNLDWNDVGIGGARALRQARALRRLESLSLGWNALGDAGCAELAQAGDLTGLRVLFLTHNEITSRGAMLLAESSALRGLRGLYLDNNQIDDAGLRALADSPNLANLEWLYLNHNFVTEQGMRALVESPYLTRLTELALSDNEIEAGGDVWRALRGRFGKALW